MVEYIQVIKYSRYIYCLPVTDSWDENDSLLVRFLSSQRQERVMHYVFNADRKLSLYAALLARLSLSIASGIPASKLTFSIDNNKKPFQLSKTGLHFNLSHTHGFVLCGVSDVDTIGMDVEICASAPFEIMEQVFHPEEIQHVINATILERNSRFYKIWTRKESYTKKLGTGLICVLKSYNTLSPALSSSLHTWKQEDFICSVCGTPISELNIKYISEADILDYFTQSTNN